MVKGDNFGVDEAKALGLLSEIFPEETFREDVLAYAQQFVPPNKASKSVGMIKERWSVDLRWAFLKVFHRSANCSSSCLLLMTPKNIASYVEKRKAAFQGR